MILEIDFPKPQSIGVLNNIEILTGLPIPPIDRLRTFGPDQFEDFVREWVVGYLMKNDEYSDCKKCSGAGDKGRDVIARINNREWVNYQCKHYKEPLVPSDIYKEIIKLAYYTFNKDFTVPIGYYFVSPHGAGPKLNSFLEDPEKLKSNLYDNWQKNAEIGKNNTVILDDSLRAHIDEKVPFTIFHCMDPQVLIDQHKNTAYFVARFGGGLQKRREVVKNAPYAIQQKELVYTKELLKAYSEFKNLDIEEVNQIEPDNKLFSHFQRQRIGFFSADSLKQYSRDTLPPDCDYFEDLKEQFYSAIIDISQEDYNNGFERVNSTIKHSHTINITASPLVSNLRIEDRTGICHHLVNDSKIKWIL